MSWLKSIVAEHLVGLMAILAAIAFGYAQGEKHNEQKWLANQAKVERSARVDYDAQARAGEAAAAQYLKDTRALTGQFNELTEKFNGLRKRIPLVVASRPTVCAHDLRDDRSKDKVPGNTIARTETEKAALGDGAGATSLVLTHGAVWMWNSALTGTDQPAHACGATNPTAAACAAATSLTVDDAWDNHIANAQACAANRLAHQRLIDFIQQKESALTKRNTP